jgi:HEAT repeat protein
VRRAVVRAVGDRGDEGKEGTQFLLKIASSDSSPEIRRSAVSSIGEIGSPAAREALIELLK